MDEPREGQLVWVVNNSEDLEHIWFALKELCFSLSIYPHFHYLPPHALPTSHILIQCSHTDAYKQMYGQTHLHQVELSDHLACCFWFPKNPASSKLLCFHFLLPICQLSGHICISPSLHVYRASTTIRNQSTCFTIRGKAVVNHSFPWVGDMEVLTSVTYINKSTVSLNNKIIYENQSEVDCWKCQNIRKNI